MRVHFGGPDKPAGTLARLIGSRIDLVPAGGEIHWITYYFGNEELALELLAASRRGVRVRATIDASPRRPKVNARVSRMLGGAQGLADGFVALRHLLPCHVHEKLYYFSHPRPTVFAGSFNPSRDAADPPDLVRDIGDQDRGHNFLVEITDPAAVSFLCAHMNHMHVHPHGVLEQFGEALNATFASSDLGIAFYPRRKTGIHLDALRLPGIERVRIASSHFRDRSVARQLARLAAKGVQVEVLAHATARRVPGRIERLAVSAGIGFVRYARNDDLPMHNKFMLLEGRRLRAALFGSFNLTLTSRWLNHEVLMQSGDPEVFAAFDARWHEMMAETQAPQTLPAPREHPDGEV